MLAFQQVSRVFVLESFDVPRDQPEVLPVVLGVAPDAFLARSGGNVVPGVQPSSSREPVGDFGVTVESNQELGADDLPIAQKEAAPAHGNGAHPAGLSIPFTPSFDLTGVLESAEKELIVRTLNVTHERKPKPPGAWDSPVAPWPTSSPSTESVRRSSSRLRPRKKPALRAGVLVL